jgi:CBS domain-containing protein
MFTVAEVMSKGLITVREEDVLENASDWLELAHIRHLPVVRGKKLVGLLTHRDLLRQASRRSPDSPQVTAREAMTTDVTTITPDTPVREAIRIMLRNQFGCLPVTTAGGTLVGIITESDLLRVAAVRAEELDRQELAADYD